MELVHIFPWCKLEKVVINYFINYISFLSLWNYGFVDLVLVNL